ncbi:MAG: transglutaminase domain-containing protein [Cyanobacteria bacterium P01_D01_bin.56]
MSNTIETHFLTELRKRQRQQKRQTLFQTATLILLFCLGCTLAYVTYAAPVVGCLVTIVVFAIAAIQHSTNINFSNKQIRYVLGFSLLALAFIYQGNPNLLNVPVGNLYVRLVHNPLPQTQTISTGWPWTTEQHLHPAIVNMPADADTSIQSVARYILQQESDPQQQVKAVHDYVLKHLSYDTDVLTTGQRPPQDAENVFLAKKAVCEGYAKLFQALGKAVGLDVVYLTGDVRRDLAPIDVIPKLYRATSPRYDWTLHAWNAVKIDDGWQLVDTTWDDSDRRYTSNYLMPPAKVMISSHLPTLSAWQLLEEQKNKQTFEQAPILLPAFFGENLELISPNSYTTKAKNTGKIQIQQPLDYQRKIVAVTKKEKNNDFSIWDWSKAEESTKRICQSQPMGNNKTEIMCDLADAGTYQVFLISIDKTTGDWFRLGQLKFHVA